MCVKNYIYYISIFLVLSSIFYIGSIESVIQFIIFIIIYWTIFYWVYFTYKKIRNREVDKYKDFLINFIKKSSLSIVILVTLIWTFWYYQIYVSPAKMIEYTISNWNKKVVFQEMSHIGAKSFYEEIKQNLIIYKKDNFVYFYEWVKLWKKENREKFNKAMWIDFNEDLYKNFSKLYWVSHQNNEIYYNLVNNLDFNVDVSIDWIIEQYEEKNTWDTNTIEGEAKLDNKEIIDVNSKVLETLSSINEKQLKVLVFVNKSILNFLIKSDKTQKVIKDNFANKKLFKIILHWRNKILAEEIIKSEYNNIYVTYWKLHFNWVLKLLKENDTNWKIVSKKELISIK